MNIIKKQIKYNISKRTQAIKYIVIHDTGNKSKGADADAHFNYFNGGNRNSSADFFVDDEKILQINDYTEYYTWQCGDGKGKYGITNSNSIGIEICVNSDGNYDKAFEKAIELTKHLMKELNIPAERVVRHYDASRKSCPASMKSNNWSLWNEIKEKLTATTPVIKIQELTTVNDIVWELAERGIITDKNLWLKKLKEDENSYWLARKAVNSIRGFKY